MSITRVRSIEPDITLLRNQKITNIPRPSKSTSRFNIVPPFNPSFLKILCDYTPTTTPTFSQYQSQSLGTSTTVIPSSTSCTSWAADATQSAYRQTQALNLTGVNWGITQVTFPAFQKTYGTLQIPFSLPTNMCIVIVDAQGNETTVASGNMFSLNLSSQGSGSAVQEFSYYLKGTGTSGTVRGPIIGKFAVVTSGTNSSNPDMLINFDTVGQKVYVKPFLGNSTNAFSIKLYDAGGTLYDTTSFSSATNTSPGYATFTQALSRQTLYQKISVTNTNIGTTCKTDYSRTYTSGATTNTFFTLSQPYAAAVTSAGVSSGKLNIAVQAPNPVDVEDSSVTVTAVVYPQSVVEAAFQQYGDLAFAHLPSSSQYASVNLGTLSAGGTASAGISLTSLNQLYDTYNNPVASNNFYVCVSAQDGSGKYSAWGISPIVRIYDPNLDPSVKNNLAFSTTSASNYTESPDPILNMYYTLNRSSTGSDAVYFKVYDFSTTGLSASDLTNSSKLLQVLGDSSKIPALTYTDTTAKSSSPTTNTTNILNIPSSLKGKTALVLACTTRSDLRSSDVAAVTVSVVAGSTNTNQLTTTCPILSTSSYNSLTGKIDIRTSVGYPSGSAPDRIKIRVYSKAQVAAYLAGQGISASDLNNLSQDALQAVVNNSLLLITSQNFTSISSGNNLYTLTDPNAATRANYDDYFIIAVAEKNVSGSYTQVAPFSGRTVTFHKYALDTASLPTTWNNVFVPGNAPSAYQATLTGNGELHAYTQYDNSLTGNEQNTLSVFSANAVLSYLRAHYTKYAAYTISQLSSLPEEVLLDIIKDSGLSLAVKTITGSSARQIQETTLTEGTSNPGLSFSQFYDTQDQLLLLNYTVVNATINSTIAAQTLSIARGGMDAVWFNNNQVSVLLPTTTDTTAYACTVDWVGKKATLRFALTVPQSVTGKLYVTGKIFKASDLQILVAGVLPSRADARVAIVPPKSTLQKIGDVALIVASIPFGGLFTSCSNPMLSSSSTFIHEKATGTTDPIFTAANTAAQDKLRKLLIADVSGRALRSFTSSPITNNAAVVVDIPEQDQFLLDSLAGQTVNIVFAVTDGTYLYSTTQNISVTLQQNQVDPVAPNTPSTATDYIAGTAFKAPIILYHPTTTHPKITARLFDSKSGLAIAQKSGIVISSGTQAVTLFASADIPRSGIYNIVLIDDQTQEQYKKVTVAATK